MVEQRAVFLGSGFVLAQASRHGKWLQYFFKRSTSSGRTALRELEVKSKGLAIR
jgi:hypothetical protein